MAIAFDAGSNGTSYGSTSISWSHTCSGSDRLLIVGNGYPDSDTITGVTYGGVAMTLVDKIALANGRWFYMWYLIAPNTGTNSIVVTSSSTKNLSGWSASYTGVKQTSPIDNSTTNSTAAAMSLTTSLTPVANNCWVVSVGAMNGVYNSYSGSLRATIGSTAIIQDNNAAITPAASTSLTFGSAGTVQIVMIMASIAPVPASGPANIKTYKGLASASVKTCKGLAIASIKTKKGLN